MRFLELLRLVKLNLFQNKFKVILTSIGLIVGSATIVMVIAIGKGGKAEVADQFKNLNAGAIDISYGTSDSSTSQNKNSSSGFQMPSGGGFPGSSSSGSSSRSSSSGSSSRSGSATSGMGGFGGFQMNPFGSSGADSRINQEKITLSMDDMDDLKSYIPGVSDVSISYTTKQSVDGGELEEATSYTIAGVLSNYADLSNLSLSIGDFITDTNQENKEKVCVLGATTAIEIFGSVSEAYDSILYIDDRPYVVNGVLEKFGTVSSGISPDEAIFIPYDTGVKYITGTSISPTITLIAKDVNNVDKMKENIESVLAETYPNSEFTIADAGSKMEAANESNKTLTSLLFAMASIVFIVGGIGIMNVLFVSIKERTKEIGILKAMGCSQKYIMLEFLLEACVISVIGGVLGVGLSFLITPITQYLGMTVLMSVSGVAIAIGFAILTGTVFGFYPAFKASRLIPVEALNED